MQSVSTEDLSFCWQQVLKHDPWFRLHFQFAPRQYGQAILALHALTTLLEETLDSSEEALTITRLQWWRTELSPEKAPISAHPVIRALREAREGQEVPPEFTDPLMAQILMRLQAEPVQDQQALKALCDQVGRAKVSAVLGLSDPTISGVADPCSFSGTGLASLVHFALTSKNQSWWFVPLALQARYQFDLNDMQNVGAGSQSVLQVLLESIETWFDEEISQTAALVNHDEGMRRYLAAKASANKIRTRRIVGSLLAGNVGSLGRWKLSDLIRVWSSSRRV